MESKHGGLHEISRSITFQHVMNYSIKQNNVDIYSPLSPEHLQLRPGRRRFKGSTQNQSQISSCRKSVVLSLDELQAFNNHPTNFLAWRCCTILKEEGTLHFNAKVDGATWHEHA